MTPETIRKGIQPLDENSMRQAQERWLKVAKPLFSLGKLEEAVVRMAGIRQTAEYTLQKKALLVFCADNGVTAENVTQAGQEVTAVVAANIKEGRATAAIMAKAAGADVFPVDIGMAEDVPGVTVKEDKIAYGTHDILYEEAMSRADAWRAVEVGIRRVRGLKEKGYDIIATGEMGIGNTTTAAAVTAVLTGKTPEETVGRGAGLSEEGLRRKRRVISEAIRRHRPDPLDAVDVLAKVGGFDIAGLTGAFLGGALYRVPVVIDGFISAAAALCAVRIAPQAQMFLIPSHVSKEPAAGMLLKELGLSAFLDCGMCLGEGSGAVAVLPLLEMGLEVYRKMATFEEVKIRQYEVLK